MSKIIDIDFQTIIEGKKLSKITAEIERLYNILLHLETNSKTYLTILRNLEIAKEIEQKRYTNLNWNDKELTEYIKILKLYTKSSYLSQETNSKPNLFYLVNNISSDYSYYRIINNLNAYLLNTEDSSTYLFTVLKFIHLLDININNKKYLAYNNELLTAKYQALFIHPLLNEVTILKENKIFSDKNCINQNELVEIATNIINYFINTSDDMFVDNNYVISAILNETYLQAIFTYMTKDSLQKISNNIKYLNTNNNISLSTIKSCIEKEYQLIF